MILFFTNLLDTVLDNSFDFVRLTDSLELGERELKVVLGQANDVFAMSLDISQHLVYKTAIGKSSINPRLLGCKVLVPG